jgi:PAS domain S-box-containing protein
MIARGALNRHITSKKALVSPIVKRTIVSIVGKNASEMNNTWSQSISFTCPEADFSGPRFLTTSSKDVGQLNWTGTLSFASPESDLFAVKKTQAQSQDNSSFQEIIDHSSETTWSETMTFASPESDFSAARVNDVGLETAISVKEDFINHIQQDEYHRNNMAYALSHASTESDFTSSSFMDLLNDRMKAQLENVNLLHENHSLSNRANPRELSSIVFTTHDFDTPVAKEETVPIFGRPMFQEQPLPRNLAEASIPNDPRAIVITEAEMPFRIVSVNDSWEQLCGYTRSECKGKTLGCIQGPETNKAAVTALMAQLLKGEEAGTVLTNYNKNGRKFHNRLRVGPLKNDNGKITHFIGVLKEVNETGENFHGKMMHA